MTKRRIWRIIRNVILVLAALVAGFLFLFVPWFFSSLGTRGHFHFPDPNDAKTPISYGMKFDWVEFTSTDGIPLKGWYVPPPGEARGTIIYCHGLNRTRVEMLPMASFGHQLGYNGLLFDFRHQGSSGGDVTTLGFMEAFDVIGAVDCALRQRHAAQPFIVWGVSMGAAAALMAAAEAPNIAAVISDSSFLSLSDTVRHHWRLFFHLPSFPIADEVLYLLAWRGGFWPSDFDLVKAVDRIGDRPVLFVALDNDRRMPPSIARDLYTRATSPYKAVIVLHGQRHGEAFNLDREQYEAAVKQFLASLPAGHP